MDRQNQHSIIEADEIRKIIPHRYPFLLVDRVLEIGPDFAVGIKNVTINEPFFPGHFPGEPIMPGVLQVEAMAQLAAICSLRSIVKESSSIYLLTIDKAKFRKKVIPGDVLNLEIRIKRTFGTKLLFTGKARVGDTVASETEILAIAQKH